MWPLPRVQVEKTEYRDVVSWRDLYRAEANCQIVGDSALRRGIADPYLLIVDGKVGGYAGVWNKYSPDRIHEFYVLPHLRGLAQTVYRVLIEASDAKEIEAQTNMPLMLLMFFDLATNVRAENVLFADDRKTEFACPGADFRAATEADKTEDGYVLEVGDKIVGGGGYLTHYNPPYGDIYMQVAEEERGKGYGTFIVQEAKRLCYEAGKVPGARCNASNVASRRTLTRAGFLPVGRLLVGDVGRS